MKNKNLLKLICLYTLAILFLIVGSIIAAAAAKVNADYMSSQHLFYSGISVLFFFLFAISFAIAIYYSIVNGFTFKKKVSDEIKIEEIQKIEPIIEE